MRIYLLLLLVYCVKLVSAQEEQPIYSYPKYAVGVTPSALFHTFGGLQISQDFGLTDDFNFTLESAYLFSSIYKRALNGTRIRGGFEHLFYADRDFGVQIGLTGLYRYTKELYFREIFYPEGYTEKVPITKTKTLYGIVMSFGLVTYISDRFLLETGLGLGYGKLLIEDDLDNGMGEEGLWNIFTGPSLDSPGTWDIPITYFHLNFSYRIF